MKYTDADGNNPVVAAVLVAAAVSALSYTIHVATSPGGFSNWNWVDFAGSLITGSVQGMLTYGIGSAFGATGKIGHELLRAAAHGSEGYIFGLTGGNETAGFLSSASSSLVGSALSMYGKNSVFLNSDAFGYTAVGITGGLSSKIVGGNFWEGASNGVITEGLNHLAHQIYNDAQLKKMYSIYKESMSRPTDDPATFYQQLGGEIAEMTRERPEDFQNTCAARLSKALNYAGFKIPKGTKNTFSGGDGNYYFLQAKALAIYISKRLWGPLTQLKKNYNLKNAVYFQEGFGEGVTGHLDIMYRSHAAHEFYTYPSLTTSYW